jgi:hypothetical protein
MIIDPSVAPTLRDLEMARAAIERNEPRALFYKVAAELVDLSLRGQSSITVAEAMAVLLQTWNAPVYRLRPFDSQNHADIERLVATHRHEIEHFRPRSLDTFSPADEPVVHDLFCAFEQLLGPDGGTKCLHLLAPLFLPIWDHAIARAYGLQLEVATSNLHRYLRFMEITRQQWERLGGLQGVGRNPLRAIDEYNYCHCCKHWL